MPLSWICDSIDLVSLRELSKELATDSISTSVARDLAKHLAGIDGIRRPNRL